MGKFNIENRRDKENETKLLYKKSNNTIFTHSRTCSGVSQLYSRSAVLQIKKNLQETSNYYTIGGKIRRDLSLETDICVLRRYYKNKRYKTSTYDSSAKFSTVIDTEVETIEEFPDTSACGDNDQTDLRSNPTLDIATLMIDNLKELLSKWFQRHLVDNKRNREKIDTVIDVLLSQLEQKSDGSSSYSTYIVHREENNQPVKDKKIDTHSFNQRLRRRSFYKTESSKGVTHNESSSLSIPFPHMISTLSIPRSFHKKLMYNNNKIKFRSSLCKLKNTRRNDVIIPFDRSNNFQQCSSIDFLDFISKSKSKYLGVDSKNKITQVIFQPVCKSCTNDTISIGSEEVQIGNLKVDNVKDIPTLLKSLYIDDPNNLTNADRNYICEIHRHETFTVTDSTVEEISNQSVNINLSEELSCHKKHYRTIGKSNKPTLAIGFVDNTMEFPQVSMPKDIYLTKPRNSRKVTTYKYKNKTKLTSKTRTRQFSSKFQGVQNKHFTFLYNKAKNHSEGRSFLRHCRSVIEYFVNFEGNRNIKLDVQVNVSPLHEVDQKDASTVTSKSKLSIYDIKRGPTLLYNAENEINVANLKENTRDPSRSSLDHADFITLLDGAISQSKYILGTIKKGSENAVNVDRSTITSELQIGQDISELRSIIKDLVLAAEKLVDENLKRESNNLYTGNSAQAETIYHISQTNNNVSSSKSEAVINLENLSKGIQCSSVSTKNPLLSGLKLSKEPKRKDMNEFANRLMKKSTSYRIIDSESILRVTDMTSNNKELNRQSIVDETINCSLPKSRSLFEMTTKRNKRKLMAFFCNGGCSPTTYEVEDWCDDRYCGKKIRKCIRRTEDKVEFLSRPSYECSESCLVPASQILVCEGSASTYSQVDLEANKCEVPRKGMGFSEGCFYCFLLWIPVVIIMVLFYVYVLKELVQPQPSKTNLVFLKLSDFGY